MKMTKKQVKYLKETISILKASLAASKKTLKPYLGLTPTDIGWIDERMDPSWWDKK